MDVVVAWLALDLEVDDVLADFKIVFVDVVVLVLVAGVVCIHEQSVL